MLSIVINCYGVMKTMAKETQVQTNEEAEKKHVDELVARVAAAQKNMPNIRRNRLTTFSAAWL